MTHVRLGGRGPDGVGQLLNGDRHRRGRVAVAGPVEADEGVEVDDAAALELGHLREADRHVLAQLGARDAEPVGEAAAQGDGEAAPQLGGVPVERDLPGVVVAVRAQRCAEVGVVVAMDTGAAFGPAVRAEGGLPAVAGVAGSAGAAGGVHPARTTVR